MQKWHEKANGPGQKPKKATKRHSKGWTKRVDVSQQENMRFSWYFHRNSKDFADFQLFRSLSASALLKEPFVSNDGATHPLIQLYPVYITFVVAILWCFSCDIIIFGGYQPNWPCSGKTLAFFSVSTGPLGTLGPPPFLHVLGVPEGMLRLSDCPGSKPGERGRYRTKRIPKANLN